MILRMNSARAAPHSAEDGQPPERQSKIAQSIGAASVREIPPITAEAASSPAATVLRVLQIIRAIQNHVTQLKNVQTL
ncbi:hypothetical protein [Leisingera daeponensis]|uniref:hypothetical protein n=1 Tax=Leisingera daeponensis TaxID=405746 RepID=UPI0021BDB2AF|nr:hypothetical protein [Leisingera daeponensis]